MALTGGGIKMSRQMLVTALAVAFVGSTSAEGAVVLGAFGKYGLLINNGVAGGDINTAPVNASIGIGNITGTINLHNEVVNGFVDASGTASTVVSGGNITGTVPLSLGGTTPSVLRSNVGAVGQAINAALGISSLYGGQAASGTNVTFNGTVNLNASAGFLTADGVRLFSTTTFKIGNSNTVTVNGGVNDYVVINVTGGSGNKLDGAFALAGGITSDHVILNFIGSGGNLQGAANNAAINATVLAPRLGIQLNSLVLNGRLFGGAAGTNFQFVSNARINQPPNVSVPEPATWAMMIAGFGMIGFATRRRPRGSISSERRHATF